MKATELKGKTNAKLLAAVGPLATADQRKTGILAAVTLAQFILESGWAKSTLAQEASNFFGMKKSLSGNSWAGSTWDGKSVYTIQTKEQEPDGTEYTVTADFRKYDSVEASIGDHSAYLAGAKNGTALRYAGLVGETDYRKAAQIIKDGGYATDISYVDKLCKLVEQYSLTKYNATDTPAAAEPPAAPAPSTPYLVKVTATALNVRKGPGTNYGITMTIRDHGVYTIVAEQNGWGKLKSGAGWIKLSYTIKR